MQEERRLQLNRILSALIDGLIILLIVWAAMAYPTVELIKEVQNGVISTGTISFFIISFFAGMILGVLYLFVCYLLFKNASFGMHFVHLTFIKYDGSKPKKMTLFYRSIFQILSFIFSLGFVVVANLISVLNNAHARNFQDYFFGIKMVNNDDL